LAVIATEDPHGVTPDQIARALHQRADGALIQAALEDVVAQGVLDRRGVSRGALDCLQGICQHAADSPATHQRRGPKCSMTVKSEKPLAAGLERIVGDASPVCGVLTDPYRALRRPPTSTL